ncbi:MAG: putative toxin-antitoxin system toxin component, PIN family [Deltaproteobacteria bacterium]|nr:putative toxin-antitoxin system toxin component, PIN family [Deltaproteobacteria bacterium]
MIKVVIDTNVFISSFFGGIPREVINLWRDGQITICISQSILEEYIKVLNRLGIDKHEITKLTKLFAEGYNLIFAATTPKIEIVKDDPDDNKFIECAVELGSKTIISGDKHLLNIGKYIDIKILSPREFMHEFFNKSNR